MVTVKYLKYPKMFCGRHQKFGYQGLSVPEIAKITGELLGRDLFIVDFAIFQTEFSLDGLIWLENRNC